MAALSAAFDEAVEETRAARRKAVEMRARACRMRAFSSWQRASARRGLRTARQRLDRLELLTPPQLIWTPLTTELDDVLVPVD